jgi:hypothetical protein
MYMTKESPSGFVHVMAASRIEPLKLGVKMTLLGAFGDVHWNVYV